MINAKFLLQVRASRLIAYGRHRNIDAPPQLINQNIWLTLAVTKWEESTAGEQRRGGSVFYDVRVYPALLAPCRVDLIVGLSLATMFQKFVMEDPEFVALARQAAQLDRASHPMLVDGQFPRGIIFDWKWPLDLMPFPSFADVLNDAQTLYSGRSIIGEKSREACDVLRHRFEKLFNLLKDGLVVAQGTYVTSGLVGPIDVAQWSRPSGWIDTRGGDLLGEADNKLVPRWTGLSISAPRKSRAVGDSVKRRSARQSFGNVAAPSASTSDRPRPVAQAVAKALKAKGLDRSPGSHTFKQVAAIIAPDMPKPAKTALEMEALSKAVQRHYANN